MSLKDFRQKIDEIDKQLVQLMEERANLVEQVGLWKRDQGIPILDSQREKDILNKIRSMNPRRLPDSFYNEVFQTMIRNYRNWEGTRAHLPSVDLTSWWQKQNILVVGLGLMGSSWILAMSEVFSNLKIHGEDPQKPDEFLISKLQAYSPAGASLSQFSVVVLAAPPAQCVQWLKQYKERLSHMQLVMDLASVKGPLLDWKTQAQSSEFNIPFLPSHPMTGKSSGGSLSAEAGLFIGKPWVLCEPYYCSEEVFNIIVNTIKSLGSHVVKTGLQEHDEMVAFTSHIPQFVSTVLTLAVKRYQSGRKGEMVYGGGLKDMTRLASSPYILWREIAHLNSGAIDKAFESFIQILLRFRQKISTGEFQEEFDQAKKFRETTIL